MIHLELKLLSQCERCGLSKTRTQVVLPLGNEESPIMFIGEAPGSHEDKYGSPFVGSAGKIFTHYLEEIGLTRKQVYITNIVKCRPTTVEGRNRIPTDLEVSTCGVWLAEEVKKVKPKVIVLMGGTALKGFFTGCKISNVAGEELEGHIVSQKYGTKIFALYHPAVLIYNKKDYQEIYDKHIEKLKILLKEEGIIV